MHICFVTHEYPLPGIRHGGVGSFVRTLARKLIEHHHRVSVIGTGYSDNGYLVDSGVHIYPIKHSRLPFAAFVENSLYINKILKKIHSQYPIDIVETPEAGLAFIHKNSSTRYFIRMHGGHHFFTIAERRPKEKWKVIQEKRSFKKADAFIAVSKYVLETTKKLVPFSQPCRVIYNPVDLNSFGLANKAMMKPAHLLFTGTICEKKGIRQLVQAMPLIQKEHPGTVLKIVGRDWYFPGTGKCYTDYLRSFIEESLVDYIQFIGHVPHEQMPHYISEAEVCVFPSHMEAMPIAWIEAMAMGKAVVGSTSGPGPEAVIHNKTGLLANPHDPADIAEKVSFMLRNKEAASTMAGAARQVAFDRFDIEKCVHENISFYQEQLATRSKQFYEIPGNYARRS